MDIDSIIFAYETRVALFINETNSLSKRDRILLDIEQMNEQVAGQQPPVVIRSTTRLLMLST